ncbi:hypothetical protein BDA96_08G033300 [Sorghum bicolor]|uniref:Ubiquitinyl hydrolase 1 n=1 Tax=Sorghum bicolor TaxID=4558 RepID=A0A921QDX0_SORBI|nr:hypothetical protein BDA96_08G033300 [Sorghum bicolor]
MAEKGLPPRKRVRFRFTSNPSAGSSAGGGGGDGDGAAAPAPALRQEPSSSAPRSPSPPKPLTCNPGAGSRGGGGAAGQELSYSPPPLSPSSPGDEDPGEAGRELSYSPPSLSWSSSDDEDKLDEFQTRNGWGSLFMSDPQVLSAMCSSDPQNPPCYIGRQNCEPLTRQKFLSLHHNWQQLLDGKNTYLRPPKNNRVAKDNDDDSIFVTPEPLELTLQCQMPLSYLVNSAGGIPTIQQKYKILSEHYVCFRPVRSDGSQFYRAFFFSYLENLGKMQCSQAEVTRLMECVARSRVNFRRLKWNNAYFSNPEAFFSSVVSEFEHLVNLVANGLNSDDLYEISLQEISSSRILSLLRLMTEVHIRTHEADYSRVLSQKNAHLFCIESVRPFGAGIEILQIRAISQALGIPVHVAVVDGAMKDGTVQVLCLDFVPQSESGVSRTSGSLSSIRQYSLSSATDQHPVLPAGNLFLSDRMPLVTIFMTTANTTAIMYRK